MRIPYDAEAKEARRIYGERAVKIRDGDYYETILLTELWRMVHELWEAAMDEPPKGQEED